MAAKELLGAAAGVGDDGGLAVEVGGGHGTVVEGDDHGEKARVSAGPTNEVGKGFTDAPTVGSDLPGDRFGVEE